jgi:hypothetical protein
MNEQKIKKVDSLQGASLQDAMNIYGRAMPIDDSSSVCKEIEGVPELVPAPEPSPAPVPTPTAGELMLKEHLDQMNTILQGVFDELKNARLSRVTGSTGIEGEGMWYVTGEVPVQVATPNLPPVTPGGPMQTYDPDLIAFDTYTETFGPSPIGYQRERVRDVLKTRNAPRCTVINDGNEAIYVISSINGRKWSPETPILPYEARTFFNVWELRIRCPVKGDLTASPFTGGVYRVTEFDYWLAYSRLVTVAGGPISINLMLTPTSLSTLQNVAQPAVAGNPILGAALVPVNTPTTFRVMVAMSNIGNFNALITNGGNTQTVLLNAAAGPALVATGLYTFDILINAGDSVNFSYTSTGGFIQILRVQEVDAAVT